MSFVKCESVQVPKNMAKQHMDEDYDHDLSGNNVKSEVNGFQDYINPSPLFNTETK